MVVGLNPKICVRRIPDLSASLSLCSAVARPGGFLCAAPLAQLRAGALAETRMFAGPTEGSSPAVVCLLCGGAWRAPSVPLLVLALAARHALWSKPRPEWPPERLYLPSTLVSFRALRPSACFKSQLKRGNRCESAQQQQARRLDDREAARREPAGWLSALHVSV